MHTKEETLEICSKFYEQCYAHWLRDFANNKVLQQERDISKTVEEQAKEYAMRDIKYLQTNPNVPRGAELDSEGKDEFLAKLL